MQILLQRLTSTLQHDAYCLHKANISPKYGMYITNINLYINNPQKHLLFIHTTFATIR